MELDEITDIDKVRTLLTDIDAFHIDDPEWSEHGRTIIHTRSAHGFGADWDLDSALELLERDDVTWFWRGRYLWARTPDVIMPRGVTFDQIRKDSR